VFGAAAALDAGVGLQCDDLGDVLAGDEAEVFYVLVGGERRDSGESVALEEDSNRREHQVEMLGVGDERQEDEQRQGVGPPERFDRWARVGDKESREVGGHQGEDEKRDQARLVGDLLAEPDGADKKAS
jgi:hypothetical protein